MGIDLGLECPDFRFCQEVFLFFHFFIFINGFQHLTDAVKEFDAQFRKGFALRLGGDDVADIFIFVPDGEFHEVRHVGEGLLQFQDGNFRFSLCPVRIGLVMGFRIDFPIVNDGGPDEAGKGGNHEIRGFGEIGFIEAVMKGIEKGVNRIEGSLRGFCFFRISLTVEEIDDQVENPYGCGTEEDDNRGKAQVIVGVFDGCRIGEESKEDPEKDFQNEGIEKGPAPELVMMLFQPGRKETGCHALKDGKAPVNIGKIGINKESAVNPADNSGNRSDNRTTYETGQNNADSTEIQDTADADIHIPVRPYDGEEGKNHRKKNDLFLGNRFRRNGFADNSRPAYEEQEDQENGNPEPNILGPDHPGIVVHGKPPFEEKTGRNIFNSIINDFREERKKGQAWELYRLTGQEKAGFKKVNGEWCQLPAAGLRGFSNYKEMKLYEISCIG